LSVQDGEARDLPFERPNSGDEEPLVRGIAAACAVVAYADGWVTPDEHRRMIHRILSSGALEPRRIDDLTEAFEAVRARFLQFPDTAEAWALDRVIALRDHATLPHLVVTACCAIAAADGGFDAEERRAILRICKLLRVDPDDFGLLEAR
jgi:tellurite resistance protein TerB